jgi:methylated-DNA-protein-cysteine methyltransferase-like protein
MTNPGSHDLHALIYEVTRKIPRGKVATYGQVAALAGLPEHARVAGYALFNLPPGLERKVPWQRGIHSRGEISYSESRRGGDFLQRELLEKEGVEFDARGRVDLKRYRWEPKDADWMEERLT